MNSSAASRGYRLGGSSATAALAFQVAPAAHEAGRQVLEPCEFDLQLALVALCARAENFEDQHRAVGHRHTEVLFQIALLSRRQGLVEQHGFGLVTEHERFDLVGLAGPDEQGRIGCFATCDHTRNRSIARRFGEQREFVERSVERLATTEVHAHQNRPGGALRPVWGNRFRGTQGTARLTERMLKALVRSVQRLGN